MSAFTSASSPSGRGIELDPKFVAVALERLSAMGLEPVLEAAT